MTGVIEALAPKAAWEGIKALFSALKGRPKLTITSPRPYGIPLDIQQSGENVTFHVEGKLNFLPRDQEIWLLNEDPSTGRIWPQGLQPVAWDAQGKIWQGRVNTGRNTLTVHAVIAPPTSQDFFKYYRSVAPLTKYSPIKRIPAECVVRANVLVRFRN